MNSIKLKISYITTVIALLSILPTLASYLHFYEGNVQRSLALIMLSCAFFCAKKKSTPDVSIKKYLLRDRLCVFLICTSFISFFHILIERNSTSINYVDFFAPSCLLIYGIVLKKNMSTESLISATEWIFIIWTCFGFLELLLNMHHNSFCLPYCIYYYNRPNSLLFIQDLLGLKGHISLESLGLATQEFSVVLGLSFLFLLEHLRFKRTFSRVCGLLIVIFLQIFSLSFTVLVAEILTILIFFLNKKYHLTINFAIFIFGFFFSFFVGYFLQFSFFDRPSDYINQLFLVPLNFLLSLNWYEILFGLIRTEVYPAESRFFVLLYRFGLIWFLFAFISVIHFGKILASLKKNENVQIKIILFVYLLLVSIHNSLWQTISGTLIFSLLIIFLYESIRNHKV